MTMSTDRVHFKLELYCMDAHTRAAYRRAFGVEPPSSRHHGTEKVTIICRPSQFARFLIYRNEEGGRNTFKELEPKLVEFDSPQVIDLSSRPRVRD